MNFACTLLLNTVAATTLLLTAATAYAAESDSRPPNFIFVLSDDIAQGDLGCYGQQLIQTPRLDQMAAEGTRYLQAYCGTTVCAPSRSSFFTGLHSGHCPVRGNYGLSLVSYLKGGPAPKREYFYWELHEGGPALQAARFDDWKAVRNGIDKPIEIYDLATDAAESNNLSNERADLVRRAEAIFAGAHRPDPNWPMDGTTPEHAKLAKEAWNIKRQRDNSKWVPPNAIERLIP